MIAVATLAEANRIAVIAAKNKKRKRDLLALAAAAGPDPAPEGPADVVIADAAPGPRAFGCGRCRMNPNGCSNCKRAGYTPRGKAKAKAQAKAAGAPQDPNHGGRGRGRGAAGAANPEIPRGRGRGRAGRGLEATAIEFEGLQTLFERSGRAKKLLLVLVYCNSNNGCNMPC